MGCRSSDDSLSEFVLGGGDEVEAVESFVGGVFSLGDSAAPDLFSGETLSLVRDESPDLFLGEREGLLAPGRPPGLRPRPRPDDGRRTRFSFSLLASLFSSPSGIGPMRTVDFCSVALSSSALRPREAEEGLRSRLRLEEGRRTGFSFLLLASLFPSPSGIGPIRELSTSLRSRVLEEGRRLRLLEEGRRPRLRRSLLSS